VANEKNLCPFRTVSEAREKGHNGGVKSGQSRRQKAGIADTTKEMLYTVIKDPKQLEVIRKSGMPVPKKPRYVDFLVASTVMKSIKKGSPDDLLKLMQIVGDKPSEETEGDEAEINAVNWSRLFELVAPPFLPTFQKMLHGSINEAVENGGRGSCKSSFCSLAIWALLKKHPDCHAVCIRKVGNTLRNSVYAQMQWAINELEPGKWKCTTNPMEITNLETGQKILFFGLDDPGKLKSIKLPFGYIGVLWFEELDQYAGPEEIRNVEQSCLRGGSFSFVLKSFNPPMSPRNWANQYAMETAPKRLVQHTDYRTTPEEWLGPAFIERAEMLRDTNPTAYAHEYLGEVTGCGKEIFTNIRAERITDAQIKQFDRIYHGVDWGFYPDPWAFNSCYYDHAHRTLYVFDELTRWGMNNEDTFALLKERGILQRDGDGERLTADSAEKKSCYDYTRWGLKCYPAIKGPGSVETGTKWLQGLTAIVIDPVRCPDTLKEFLEYEYEADKNGEPMPGYPDYNNHHIDGIRYSTECIWRRPGE